MIQAADNPLALTHLLQALQAAVDAQLDGLETGDVSAEQWQRELERLLARYHTAAYLAGQGSATLDAPATAVLAEAVGTELEFLDGFRVTMADSDTFMEGWRARTQLYTEAIGASFNRGAFRAWPLPALPKDGTTQCLSRCRCRWEIVELEGEGNADCYWIYGGAERHCQTCKEREGQWAPLKIRNGRLAR